MKARHCLGWGVLEWGPGKWRDGTANQDSWLVPHYWAGTLLAVSDELGSGSNKHVGFRAACRAVAEACRVYQERPLSDLGCKSDLVQLVWPVVVSGLPPSEGSLLCLFVLVRNEASAIQAQLGDGMGAARHCNVTVDVLAPDRRDSFANFAVALATEGARAEWRAATESANRYCTFLICTDGIADELKGAGGRRFDREVEAQYEGIAPRR